MGKPPDWDRGLKALGAQNLQEGIVEKETLLLQEFLDKGPRRRRQGTLWAVPQCCPGG